MEASEFGPTAAPDAPASLHKVSVGRQVLQRELNDRLHARRNGEPDFQVFCECGRAGCRDGVRIEAEMYETLRRVPTHFLVKRAHAEPGERVVDGFGDFLVVEKLGEAGLEVLKLDRGKQHLRSEEP